MPHFIGKSPTTDYLLAVLQDCVPLKMIRYRLACKRPLSLSPCLIFLCIYLYMRPFSREIFKSGNVLGLLTLADVAKRERKLKS